ncbi:hypothetical protein NJ959_28740 [Symplocastrum sp. BBK-W-15]|uniref:Uncharacterized protein n=2 Tax=Limnofasciculus TaxID=3064905 RepID=A0AAE3GXS4_9CYAN|nr:hypothetical protein [Limnofasciculus baicalensis BBK-W-15]
MGRTDQKMTISTILTATQVAAAFLPVEDSQLLSRSFFGENWQRQPNLNQDVKYCNNYLQY